MLLLDASVILAAFDSDDELHGPSKTLMATPDVTTKPAARSSAATSATS
jgi:predicted nucleic acid-binding protein